MPNPLAESKLAADGTVELDERSPQVKQGFGAGPLKQVEET